MTDRINQLTAIHVMGYHYVPGYDGKVFENAEGHVIPLWTPAVITDQALQCAYTVASAIRMVKHGAGLWFVTLYTEDAGTWDALGHHLAETLCRAALRVRGVEVPGSPRTLAQQSLPTRVASTSRATG